VRENLRAVKVLSLAALCPEADFPRVRVDEQKEAGKGYIAGRLKSASDRTSARTVPEADFRRLVK
jgi:hypothetical protein